MKRILANLVLLTVVLSLGFGAMELATRLLWPDWRDFNSGRFMQVVDVPGLGTTVIGQPGFDGTFSNNNADFRTNIKINAFGHRELVPVEAADGRIWVVGDSFSFGWGVEFAETYAVQLENLTGFKTYNIANPGTNVCGYQAAIARMPATVKPKALIVGLTLENDLSILSCVAQREQVVRTSETNQKNQPPQSFIGLKAWLKNHLALYNFVVLNLKKNDVTRAFLASTGIMADIKVDILQNNQRLALNALVNTADNIKDIAAFLPANVPMIILIIPSRIEIVGPDADILLKRRKVIQKLLNERGIATVDPFQALADAGFEKVHFANDGHWTPAGHLIAAKALVPALVAVVE